MLHARFCTTAVRLPVTLEHVQAAAKRIAGSGALVTPVITSAWADAACCSQKSRSAAMEAQLGELQASLDAIAAEARYEGGRVEAAGNVSDARAIGIRGEGVVVGRV